MGEVVNGPDVIARLRLTFWERERFFVMVELLEMFPREPRAGFGLLHSRFGKPRGPDREPLS